ncbi:N-acyl amino acid synthase FeeM domain-containing protein [Uliginosibacterium sp. H1]|uniref:N-acyl amino acid synthase FeeM domain-containing protein n=1 Tax=Uliginosibacterium sp. H1 TaxID=3114757 RepID=UPI002E19097A|nr:hypothetical protein [Uliginosibacterium sp. H1]
MTPSNPLSRPLPSPRPSRLSTPVRHAGQYVDRDGLIEPLRRLAREQHYQSGGRGFRLGLAESDWQRAQAAELVSRQQPGMPWQAPARSGLPGEDHAIVLALSTTPPAPDSHAHAAWALGTVSLRRDGLDGLLIDPRFEDALLELATGNTRVVSLQGLALAPTMLYAPVLQALLDIVIAIAVDEWQATDLLVACDARSATFYGRALGLARCGLVEESVGNQPERTVLLHAKASALGAADDGFDLHGAARNDPLTDVLPLATRTWQRAAQEAAALVPAQA